MSTIDFDQVLVKVGDRGRYQTVMFLILCIPATLPMAFLAFSNVFTNATPDHWCQPRPEFKNLNLSEAEIKHLTIPFRIRGDGEKVYSRCTMYDMNSTDIFDAILRIDNRTFSRDADSGGKFDSKIDDGGKSEYFRKSDDFRLSDEWRRAFEDLVVNGSIKTVKCEHGWIYDRTYYDDTLVTKLDLVCDSSWLPQSSTSLFYVGSLFGNVIFGWVADRWGRRRSMLWMIVLEVFVSIVTCFSKDYMTYMILRAIGGLFFPALYQIPFILGIEMMGPSHRTFAGILLSTFFAGSMSILALLAYLLRDWFRLSIATSVPFLMLFSYYWIIPESPRWLLSRGRLDEAEEILQTMARYNGKTIPKRFLHHFLEGAASTAPLIPMKIIDNKIPENINGKIISNKSEITKKLKEIDFRIPKVTNNADNSNRTHRKKSNSGQYDHVSQDPQLRVAANKPWFAKRPATYPLTNSVLQNNKGNSEFSNAKNNFTPDNNDIDRERINNHSSDRVNDVIDLDGNDIVNLKDRPNTERTSKRDAETRLNSVSLQTEQIQAAQKQEATIFDIFRYPNIRKKFFLLTFDWIANAVVYNGLSYNATSLGVNDFLAFFIAAAIEIPSYMLSWFFMDRFGRRWVLCVALATGGLGCLSCMFVPEERVWITVVLAMIGKFGVAASFSVFYVFVGELFPTVLRSQAMGLSSLLVSVGLLSFPYILQLAQYSRVLPLIILGVLSLSGSLATVFLPETLNSPMPQTLEDGENFGKNFRIFSMPKRRTRSFDGQ